MNKLQVLQTFHHAKPYKGSPLKSENLQTIRGQEEMLIFDPRPEWLRNQPGASDFFRNTCINSQVINVTKVQTCLYAQIQRQNKINVRVHATLIKSNVKA